MIEAAVAGYISDAAGRHYSIPRRVRWIRFVLLFTAQWIVSNRVTIPINTQSNQPSISQKFGIKSVDVETERTLARQLMV